MFDKVNVLKQLQSFSGSYEIHISVDKDSSLDVLYNLCEKFEAKAIVINLIQGKTRSQPMLCKRLIGVPNEVCDIVENIYHGVSEKLLINRLKIEANTKNKGIPSSNEEAEKMPNYCYFEHHIRLNIENEIDIVKFSDELKKYNGHLSKNEFSSNKQLKNRFVTQRFYKMGNNQAKEKLEEMCKFIDDKNIKYDKKIREYNIYDSNIMLDDGWIND